MNSIENLINYGIDKANAQRMIDSYNSLIGTMNGVYEITDINYIGNKTRVISLKCSLCGNEIKRTMINGRNKMSELIKSCPCQKKRKLEDEVQKNFEKQKELIEKMKSRIGMAYGDYEIVSLEDIADNPKYTMRCANCGAEKIVSAKLIDKRKDFHCTKHFKKIVYDESYIGKKNNFLTIIGYKTIDRRRKFVCRCDCGNICYEVPKNWVDGKVKSCGCMHDDLVSTHGLSGKRLYRIWSGMKQRCYNPKSIAFENYGGRGIAICDEWLEDKGLFNFIDWAMQNGYSDDLTIDRINVNGNYEPDNCRWADWFEQANNRRPQSEWKPRRKTKGHFEIDGVFKTLKEWCSEYNVEPMTVSYRMKRNGMSLIEALTIEKRTDGRPRKEV